MTTTINLTDVTIEYPSADGEPVAETYIHLYATLTTLEVLKQYLQSRHLYVKQVNSDVFCHYMKNGGLNLIY
ncbi:hypothetical protein CUN59_12525 [Cuspidothrix issatschenkoi CHARLIE-1]|uniref:Uncharacterized protein n=1 Tax=Cuspidothrix issatschenkoi CHARLIE-1 TaxID=2052836 RepID=A0A2S6CTE4_9CYAN|nr:hypothetical protein CUN59_12525 [Cuspidothrix issatschenkoi CHARLIE-1]